MPKKKPKAKQLSDAQKKEKQEISSFRCRKFGFDNLVMLIACGLHNFRITNSLIVNHI
jgi:hypothetical protein